MSKDSTSTNAAAAMLVVLGIVAALLMLAVLNGFMLSYMWEWFVVPFGLPSVSIIHAIGIAILVSMLTDHSKSSKGDDDPFIQIAIYVVARLIAFGIAFLLSGLMP
jgi:hypothetical protein